MSQQVQKMGDKKANIFPNDLCKDDNSDDDKEEARTKSKDELNNSRQRDTTLAFIIASRDTRPRFPGDLVATIRVPPLYRTVLCCMKALFGLVWTCVA